MQARTHGGVILAQYRHLPISEGISAVLFASQWLVCLAFCLLTVSLGIKI